MPRRKTKKSGAKPTRPASAAGSDAASSVMSSKELQQKLLLGSAYGGRRPKSRKKIGKNAAVPGTGNSHRRSKN